MPAYPIERRGHQVASSSSKTKKIYEENIKIAARLRSIQSSVVNRVVKGPEPKSVIHTIRKNHYFQSHKRPYGLSSENKSRSERRLTSEEIEQMRNDPRIMSIDPDNENPADWSDIRDGLTPGWMLEAQQKYGASIDKYTIAKNQQLRLQYPPPGALLGPPSESRNKKRRLVDCKTIPELADHITNHGFETVEVKTYGDDF